MTLKAAYKYQLSDMKRPVIIFYCVIFTILIFLTGAVTASASSGASTMSYLDFSSAIFLFVAGLCSFKEPFLMLLQNGVSRKTVFRSKVLTTLSVVSVMALIDKMILLLGKAAAGVYGNFKYFSLYEQAYADPLLREAAFLLHMKMFLFDFLMCFTSVWLGIFITVLFYRLNRVGKIAVGAGVPVALTFVFPLIDSLLFHSKISSSIIRFLDFAFGIASRSPLSAMISFAVLSAILGALSWLLMRRAVVRQ